MSVSGFQIKQIAISYAASACLVLTTTVITAVLVVLLPLVHVSTIFIVPVLIAAMSLGLGPAIFAAILSVLMGALFYNPRFSFHVAETADILDLLIFSIVAIVVSRLTGHLRVQIQRAKNQQAEMRRLYALSRDMSSASDPEAIYTAIASHLSRLLQRPVSLLVEEKGHALHVAGAIGLVQIPEKVWVAAGQLLKSNRDEQSITETVVDQDHEFLMCALFQSDDPISLVAVVRCNSAGVLGQHDVHETLAMLTQASISLQRVGVAHALDESRVRKRTDELRNLLITSVAHELRTPLCGVFGAATVLADAQPIANNEKLADLVTLIAEESQRLNTLIQNVLDAARIRSGTLIPRLEWVEVADVMNGAIDRCRDRLKKHRLVVHLTSPAPLLHLDGPLMEQALVNILENSAKYSPLGSKIVLSLTSQLDRFIMRVEDEGKGITSEDAAFMFDMGYRNAEQDGMVSGSGMGLAVAKVFVEANGGSILARAANYTCGTIIEINLPRPTTQPSNHADENLYV